MGFHASFAFKYCKIEGKYLFRIVSLAFIYIWKILEGIVPNPNNQIVQIANGHRGRRCIRNNLPKTKASVQTLLDQSFIHNGPKLFNCLPSGVRNLTACSVITFKNNLDKFLKTIRDEPPVANTTMHRSAISNSIPDPTNGYKSGPSPIERTKSFTPS